jgi:hypothetical protein
MPVCAPLVHRRLETYPFFWVFQETRTASVLCKGTAQFLKYYMHKTVAAALRREQPCEDVSKRMWKLLRAANCKLVQWNGVRWNSSAQERTDIKAGSGDRRGVNNFQIRITYESSDLLLLCCLSICLMLWSDTSFSVAVSRVHMYFHNLYRISSYYLPLTKPDLRSIQTDRSSYTDLSEEES